MRKTLSNKWLVTSFQKAIFLASIKDIEDPVFIEQRIITLPSGDIFEHYIDAWNDVLAHHYILKAQFFLSGTNVYLYYLDGWNDSNTCRTIDVKTQKQADKAFQNDYNEPFMFDSGVPLWRLLVVEQKEKIQLCLTFHHIIIDQRTIDILLRDFYVAFKSRQCNEVTQLQQTGRFDHYLNWLEKQDFKHLKDKWISYAENFREPTHLPSENEEVLYEDRGEVEIKVFSDKALSDKIRDFSKAHQLTANSVLLGVWAFVLSRLTFQDTICFGVVRAGYSNTLSDANAVAGPFIKTLPFIQSISANLTPEKYLKDVHQRWKFLYEVEHCPTDLLIGWTRRSGVEPLYSTVFNYFNTRKMNSGKESCGVKPALLKAHNSRALEPTLVINDEKSLEIKIVTPKQHEKFCQIASEAIPQVIRQMLTSDKPLGSISLCANKKELIALSQGPVCRYEQQTVAAYIEKSFTIYKDQLAIDGLVQKTFSDLDLDTRDIASQLDIYKFDKTRPIAIFLPAIPLCVTVILTIVRAGRPFICIDPGNTIADAFDTFTTCNPSTIVTLNKYLDLFANSEWSVSPVIENQFNDSISFEFDEKIKPHDLVYMVSTSGSTGKQKIIQIEHHAAANLISAILPIYAIEPGDRRFQWSRPGPDVFVAEILTTLTGGATLVMPDRSGTFIPEVYLSKIERYNATITSMPSSYFGELVNNLVNRIEFLFPPSLRLIITGMEAVDPEVLSVWNALKIDIQLLNVYGPSETTIISAYYPLIGGTPPGEKFVPIGRPLSNTSVYILDAASQPLPQGALGEICIAGVGLMRGYIEHDSDQKIQHNPHDNREQFSRLYRTGDFGYINALGDIVFVSRRDSQVKIRGQRVELAAVEMHLAKAAGNISAVSVIIERENQNILVGMVESTLEISRDSIYSYLRGHVKACFIPSTILTVDKFPRLLNEKIDRQQLKIIAEEAVSIDLSSNHISTIPGSNLGKMIRIWNMLFKTCDCSRQSNFFECGGDSLLAMQVCFATEERLKLKCSLTDVYSTPILNELVQRIENTPENADTKLDLGVLSSQTGF